MMGADWTGFVSRKWNPEELRAEREAWEAEHLPRLRRLRDETIQRRAEARQAFDTLDEAVQHKLAPYLSL